MIDKDNQLNNGKDLFFDLEGSAHCYHSFHIAHVLIVLGGF